MLLFQLEHRKQFSSYTSGKSYGGYCYRFLPDCNPIAIKRIVDTLRLNPKHTDVFFYRYGFLTGYVDEYKRVHNRLHQLYALVKETEDIAMARLNDIKAEASTEGLSAGFIKPTQLVNKAFCIKHVSHVDGNYGPQWNMRIEMLTVDILDNLMEKYGIDPTTDVTTMTCSMLDKDTSRDRTLVKMMSKRDYPVHACTFKPEKSKNGLTFMDMIEHPQGACPCGETLDTNGHNVDDIDLGDLGDHPF